MVDEGLALENSLIDDVACGNIVKSNIGQIHVAIKPLHYYVKVVVALHLHLCKGASFG